jgi:hypothetical protein
MDRGKGEIRGLRSPTTWRGAEAIAIFISPTDEASPHFRVSVVSEHVLKTQLLGKDFKDTIVSEIENQLGIPSRQRRPLTVIAWQLVAGWA